MPMNMEEAIKLLLDRVGHIETNMATRQQLAELRAELRGESPGVKTDIGSVKTEIGELRAAIREGTRFLLESASNVQHLLAQLERRNPPPTQ